MLAYIKYFQQPKFLMFDHNTIHLGLRLYIWIWLNWREWWSRVYILASKQVIEEGSPFVACDGRYMLSGQIIWATIIEPKSFRVIYIYWCCYLCNSLFRYNLEPKLNNLFFRIPPHQIHWQMSSRRFIFRSNKVEYLQTVWKQSVFKLALKSCLVCFTQIRSNSHKLNGTPRILWAIDNCLARQFASDDVYYEILHSPASHSIITSIIKSIFFSIIFYGGGGCIFNDCCKKK